MPRHVLFLRLAYQAGMCLLALVAVTLTAIDLTTEAAEWEVTADRTIYWIFVLDYVIRFSISRSKWLFVKEHPWDLLAIIPFDALFRLFRFASLGEILRLARYLDLFSYAMRFTTRIRRFFNTNGFKYICIAALVIIRRDGRDDADVRPPALWAYPTHFTLPSLVCEPARHTPSCADRAP